MFCGKTSYKKIELIQNRSLRIVYNEPPVSLEKLQDQVISFHRKHKNTLLTEIYKTFSGENPYFMKSILTKKDVMYNLRTSSLLTLPKVNTKRFGLYSFSFRANHLWKQLPDHIKYETMKGFKNKLVGNWQEITCSYAIGWF